MAAKILGINEITENQGIDSLKYKAKGTILSY